MSDDDLQRILRAVREAQAAAALRVVAGGKRVNLHMVRSVEAGLVGTGRWLNRRIQAILDDLGSGSSVGLLRGRLKFLCTLSMLGFPTVAGLAGSHRLDAARST